MVWVHQNVLQALVNKNERATPNIAQIGTCSSFQLLPWRSLKSSCFVHQEPQSTSCCLALHELLPDAWSGLCEVFGNEETQLAGLQGAL